MGDYPDWAPATVYHKEAPASFVTYAERDWVCTVNHTSDTFFDPSKWMPAATQSGLDPLTKDQEAAFVKGLNGWSPLLGIVSDGLRLVLQVVDWTGGEGVKPQAGLYVSSLGLVAAKPGGTDLLAPAIAAAIGLASGVATLDNTGHLVAAQVPTTMDGVTLNPTTPRPVKATTLTATDVASFQGARAEVVSTAPTLVLKKSDEGTDQKTWDFKGSAGQMSFRALNDTYTAANNVFYATRSGYTVTGFFMPVATTIGSLGSQTHTLNGSLLAYRGTETATYYGNLIESGGTAAGFYINYSSTKALVLNQGGGAITLGGTLYPAVGSTKGISINNGSSVTQFFDDGNGHVESTLSIWLNSYSTSGDVQIGRAATTTWLNSTAKFALTAVFNSGAVAGTPGTINRIDLFNATIGFGISSGQLDYVVTNTQAHAFWCGTTKAMSVSPTAIAALVPVTLSSTLKLAAYTVATLPTASANAGAIAYVTDASAAPAYNGTATGGGSVKAKVWSNGTSWLYG